MEYEIDDDPQGLPDHDEGDRDGGITEDHRALRIQSSVQPGDYPPDQRRDQSLTEIQTGNS